MCTTRDANLKVCSVSYSLAFGLTSDLCLQQTVAATDTHFTCIGTCSLMCSPFPPQYAVTHVPWISLERLEVALTFACSAIATRPVPAAVALGSASAAMANPARVSIKAKENF